MHPNQQKPPYPPPHPPPPLLPPRPNQHGTPPPFFTGPPAAPFPRPHMNGPPMPPPPLGMPAPPPGFLPANAQRGGPFPPYGILQHHHHHHHHQQRTMPIPPQQQQQQQQYKQPMKTPSSQWNAAPPQTQQQQQQQQESVVPVAKDKRTTIFVGNISNQVDNAWILRLLQVCGPVHNWNRLKDPKTDQFKNFGFCEYASAESALLALHLLKDVTVLDQQLKIKADKKTEAFLNDYKQEKRAQHQLQQPDQEFVEIEASGEAERAKQEIERMLHELAEKKKESLKLQEEELMAVEETMARFAKDMSADAVEEKKKALTDEFERFKKIEQAKLREGEMKMKEAERQKEREKRRLVNMERDMEFRRRREGEDERNRKHRNDERRYQSLERREMDRENRIRRRQEGHPFFHDDDDDYDERAHSDPKNRERRKKRLKREKVMYYRQPLSALEKMLAEEERNDNERLRRTQRSLISLLTKHAGGMMNTKLQLSLGKSTADTALERDTTEHVAEKADGAVVTSSDTQRSTSLSFKSKKGKTVPVSLFAEEDDDDGLYRRHKGSLSSLEEIGRLAQQGQTVELGNGNGVLKMDESNDDERVVAPIISAALAPQLHRQKPIPPQQEVATQQTSSDAMPIETTTTTATDSQTIMQSLPKDRDQVFQFNLDWDLIDQQSVSDKLTPWINAKVSDLMGAEEETMVEFITGKIALHEQPSQFIADLADVFGQEEADDFTFQLWQQLLVEHEKARQERDTSL